MLRSDHEDLRGLTAALALLVGWSFIGTGLFAWWRRPANPTGALMTAAGFAWFGSELSAADDDVLFTVGITLDALFPVIAGHLRARVPDRAPRDADRAAADRRGVRQRDAAPAAVAPVRGASAPRATSSSWSRTRTLSDLLDALQVVVVLPVIAASTVLLCGDGAARPGRNGASSRRSCGRAFRRSCSMPWPPCVDLAGAPRPRSGSSAPGSLLLAIVPFGFLAGLLRSRIAQGDRLAALMADVGRLPGPEALRDALADALGDPSVELAYWLPEPGALRRRRRPAGGRDGGRVDARRPARKRIAAIRHDRSLADEPQLVGAVGAAAALALENARLAAELRARIEELRASRARIVSAGDTERRRLERNLHDGAQARMVGLAAKLGLARRKAESDPELATLLEESRWS